MQLTFNRYDEEMEKFEKMKTPVTYPSFEQIEKMKDEPDKWIMYACYVLAKAGEPKNNTEKYSRSNLQHFVNDNLVLVE